jgi:uncharacterized protein
VSVRNAAFAGHAGLTASEVRVLGCLLEKQRTTPETYPLTLNMLRLACNQSTNRDPVVEYDDETLREALHRLERRGYVRLASGRGSRAPKYRHLLADALPLGEDQHAIMCVLMLRGPQTPGELKQRAERIHGFAGLDEVHETLARLIERGLVSRRERRPGQKEERYGQLLQGAEAPDGASAGGVDPALAPPARDHPDEEPGPLGSPAIAAPPGGDVGAELQELRERVARLERELAQLRAGPALSAREGEWS